MRWKQWPTWFVLFCILTFKKTSALSTNVFWAQRQRVDVWSMWVQILYDIIHDWDIISLWFSWKHITNIIFLIIFPHVEHIHSCQSFVNQEKNWVKGVGEFTKYRIIRHSLSVWFSPKLMNVIRVFWVQSQREALIQLPGVMAGHKRNCYLEL